MNSSRARHEQISDWLREQITSGALAPDEKIPSESEIGARFKDL